MARRPSLTLRRMRILGSVILLIAAAIGVLALPTAALLFVKWKPDTWLNDLAQYQSLAGGLATLFAAGLATIGVWTNVLTQRQNVKQQIQAQQEAIIQQIQSNADRAREDRLEQRKEAAYLRHPEMQSLAAAFSAEISVMSASLQNARVQLAKIAEAAEPEAEELKVQAIAVFRGAHLILFEKNAERIGIFPATVVTQLVLVYSIFIAMGETFKSSLVESWSAKRLAQFLLNEGVDPELITEVEGLLKELEKIRIAPFDASLYLPKQSMPA